MRRNGTTFSARNGVTANGAAAPTSVRCAIYGRKSVEERIATNFGSIEAQREACEAYVKSQASLAWTALPQRYDDEGFTGANVARPALARLLAAPRCSWWVARSGAGSEGHAKREGAAA